MRLLWEIIKTLLRIIVALGCLLGMLYYIASTETGFQLVWQSVEKMLPPEIKVGRVQGRLLSQLEIHDLTYQRGSVRVSVSEINVDWHALRLLRYFLTHRQELQFDTNGIMTLLSHMQIRAAVLRNAHLQVGNAVVAISGTMTQGWDLRWSANIPDLAQVLPGAQGKIIASGTLNGRRRQPDVQAALDLSKFKLDVVAIQSVSGKIHLQFNQRLTQDGQLRVLGLRIDEVRVPDFAISTASKWQQGSYQQNVQLMFNPVNVIRAQLLLPEVTLAAGLNQRMTASAQVDVKDFSQFNTLFLAAPEVQAIKARVTGTFTASGTLMHPVIDGRLQADNGSLQIPAAAMRLSAIKLTTYYHTGRNVLLNGTFTTGQGLVTLAGTYGIEEKSLPLLLSVRGTDISVIDTKEYKVKVTPDLALAYRNNDVEISGKILVPYADIQPIDFSSTATLPNDVIIVNHQSPNAATPVNLALHVQVALGQQVKVKYRGLETKLQGSIQITGVKGNPLTATGEFSIEKNGLYRAYGRTLTIQHGRLIYAGNLLTNPGISLRAVQTIKRVGFSSSSQFDHSAYEPIYAGAESLTVGVAVSGMINKPHVTLFSDPAGLSQGDILSYLLFGYPQSQVKGASSLALLNVASDMYGGPDKLNVVSNLQKSLGLDELSVGSTEYYDNNTNLAHNTTTVNLGRNLGNNLSLHYSVGLFQQIQVFSLRYQINRHLALQTETSTLENGGDLLYQLDSRD